ncbi:glycosyltransferase like family 2-domain-containing protein [Flagelloscypha sp. PMI_526]|nr:glycosyltransferase like family 2-domain-containing protein [Flagelloscypha sp. PMI_526]
MPASQVPGVSILRPLKGLDANLYENLESTFQLDYPNYEILFSLDSEHDQAFDVVRQLIVKYPRANARIIISANVAGVNPKVNNLLRSYNEAAHDILWILDSNVIIERGALARAVDILNPPPSAPSPKHRIGLVHHVPFAIAAEPGIGTQVEEAFLNTNHAKMYLAINTFAIESCVMGKSNLYRRSDLEQVNGSMKPHPPRPSNAAPGEYGLASFVNYLAEDNMIGAALWHELGLRHDLSCDIARNVVGNMSLRDYIMRRVRWIRVRKHMVLTATLMEPFTESVMLCAIASASLKHLFGVPVLLSIILHFVPWIWVDLDVYASLAGHPLPAETRWNFFAGWIGRELLAFPIFLYAIVGKNTVTWRGREYTVLANGAIKTQI